MDPRDLVRSRQPYVEGDLVVVRGPGDLAPEAAQKLIEHIQQTHRRHERYFLLIDMNDAGDLSPAVRRMLAENEAAYPAAAAAYFVLA